MIDKIEIIPNPKENNIYLETFREKINPILESLKPIKHKPYVKQELKHRVKVEQTKRQLKKLKAIDRRERG